MNISNKKTLIVSLAAALGLGACGGGAGGGIRSSEATAIVGTLVGAEIGRQFGGGHGKRVTRLLGAAIGGYIGANLGHSLDANDHGRLNTAMSTAPDNSQVRWNNQQTGNSYALTPVSSYQTVVNNQPTQCRDYTMQVMMGPSPQLVKGRACMVNGQWVSAQ